MFEAGSRAVSICAPKFGQASAAKNFSPSEVGLLPLLSAVQTFLEFTPHPLLQQIPFASSLSEHRCKPSALHALDAFERVILSRLQAEQILACRLHSPDSPQHMKLLRAVLVSELVSMETPLLGQASEVKYFSSPSGEASSLATMSCSNS